MKLKEGISFCMVVHNEERLIRRCLESIKDVADEILILHDGPCKDNTLTIAREYTKNVFATKKNTGLPGPILPKLFRKVKYEWVFKLDADEFLSKGIKKNIRRLIKNPKVDAYTFRWPYWNGKRYVTQNWPRKVSLYRISKISYFGFPHWDDPRINGKVKDTNYQLHHQPILKNPLFSWREFVNKGLKRYGRIQAEYTLKDFNSFDKFQWREKDFTLAIRIRRKIPILSSIPFAFLGFFKTFFTGAAWKEGKPAFQEAYQSFIYYPYVGYLIHRLKKGRIERLFT